MPRMISDLCRVCATHAMQCCRSTYLKVVNKWRVYLLELRCRAQRLKSYTWVGFRG